VKDRFAGCNQVVSDDPSMTPPPQSLRAHEGGWHLMPEIKQPPEGHSKIVA
jgi:hypothetical protein